MSEKIIGKMQNLQYRFKVTFASVLIFGLLSQGMGLVNKFSIHDDIGNFGVGATLISGRWMLEVLEIIERRFYGDGHYSLPLFNGFISILCIAFIACLIIDLLHIEKIISCVLIGGLMISFPVITSMFGYMYTVHFYMISMLLGVFGAYLVCKGKNPISIFIGIIIMGCSVGIYQAFIPI